LSTPSPLTATINGRPVAAAKLGQLTSAAGVLRRLQRGRHIG